MTMKLDLPNFADDIRKLVTEQGALPPVESWHPERIGDIDIFIDRSGKWIYQGGEMGRESVVRLFATILRLDDDGYCLVTPAEKMKIRVEDVPFIIRLMDVEGEGERQCIYFSSNVGDHFTLGEDHPLSLQVAAGDGGGDGNGGIPYVTVRRNLKARLATTVYYELAELAVFSQSTGKLGVWSDGIFFELE